MIGSVRDAAVTSSGLAYVLDRVNNHIRLYEPGSGLRAIVGREGKGPTEFTAIWAVDQLDDGRLLVSDRRAGLKILSVEDTTASLVKALQGERLLAEDVCAIDDQIFVHQARVDSPSGVVHRYDLSGRREASFGEIYPGHRMISWEMSEGMLGCHPASGTVLIAFDRRPVVWAFSRAGDRKWTLKTKDYSPFPAETRRTDDGRPSMHYDRPPEYEHPHRFHPLTEQYLLYQIRHTTTSNDGAEIESRTFRNYVIDVSSGRTHYIGSEPGGLYDLTAGYGVGATSAEFPQVAIMRFPRLANR